MSAKKGRGTKGRGAKVLAVPPKENPKASSLDQIDSPNLSAIDRASFLEGLQQNYGNPLHSTAMEEDLNVLEDKQMDKGKVGRKNIPQELKTTTKQRGAAVKRKQAEVGEGKVKGEEKRSRGRRSTGETVKARPEKAGGRKKKKGELEGERTETDAHTSPQMSSQPTAKAGSVKHLAGKKPANRRSAGKTSAARPIKKQQTKEDTREKSESGSGESSDSESQEESDTGTTQQSHKRVPSSEGEADEDTSWDPSLKKAKVYSFGRTRKSLSDRSKSRKSSSGSASAEPEKASADNQSRTRRGRQGGTTDLELVLDAFLDFCDQYRESVESKAVKQSIDSFSSNVKEQLLEKISVCKELQVLKRENVKVGSLIHTKTQRLLDAKHELMRAERQVWLLQKEKAELKLRLADLRRSHTFLRDIRGLNQQYLDYRHKNPKEKEKYGASSLPALLLETKHIQAAGHQLRGINKRLEEILNKSVTCK